MGDMLQDLREHLIYHATVGYAECRDMDAVDEKGEAIKPIFEGDKHFVVKHGDRLFKITIEEA